MPDADFDFTVNVRQDIMEIVTKDEVEQMNDVVLDYRTAKDVPIGNLMPNSKFIHVINDDGDDDICINFKDSSGHAQRLVVAPYTTKGIGDIKTTIYKSNDNKWISKIQQ